MAIYGTALLSLCLLLGIAVGKLLGLSMGIDKNVGGVGIAMLLLIVTSDYLRKRKWMPEPTQQGILFWSSIYIPIVVAMAASQNVLKAVNSGVVAIVAGLASVVACFALVPLINRWGAPPSNNSVMPPLNSRQRDDEETPRD